ncbi:MAG: NHLP bacteriocin export ABC transporter permease/ATPase subunit [Cyanothece sp. SIO1E1]|nr:NHLP bacteriocin export ABC transporter permease/ATPase subunit [Cyanothece sp. SIO1E1]
MRAESHPNTKPSVSIVAINGNQQLALNDPNAAWLVESGTLAVFAIPLKEGSQAGARRYLFSVPTGEVLFGFATASKSTALIYEPGHETIPPEPTYEILAVSVEETKLRSLSPTDFSTWGRASKDRALTQLERWTENLSSICPDVAIPSELLSISTLERWESLSQHLLTLHLDFLSHLQQLEQQELAEKLTQFRERQRLNSQVTTGAMGELASIIKPQHADLFQDGPPLLIAAGAVGRAMSLTICPPARSEDLRRVKDPLEAIARASRIRIRRVSLSHNWWQRDCGPLLGYLGEAQHPIALLPTDATNYEIFDPAIGTRTPINRRIIDELAPVAYTFYRPLPEQELKALDILKFAFKGHTQELILILLTGAVATLLGMLTPQATAILIDKAIPDADRTIVSQIGLGLLAAAFGTAIFQLTQGFTMLRLQTLASATTQAAIWDQLLKLRTSFFRRYSTGDLQSRASAISQIQEQLSDTVMRTIFTSFFSLLNLGLLFFYNSQLACIAAAVAFIVIVVTSLIGAVVRRKMRPLQALNGEIFGLTVQLIGGISKLRVAAAEERAFAYWAQKYSKMLKLMLSTELAEDMLALFNTVMPTLSSMAIFWLAVLLIAKSQAAGGTALSTGRFLAFNTAFGTFISGATSLSNTLVSVLEIPILWERAQPILQESPEIDLHKADPGRLMGNVAIDHVTFRYRDDGPLTLDDITIRAQSGEFIALVGPSGSGKSTTIRLLLGFDTPEDGAIYYDGQELSGLDISAIRRQIGVVLQNGRVQGASIFENIACGALVTMDEAWAAAKLAGFDGDIDNMPMGLHTVISEGGTNLSGGQRQRLLIARALVLKPKILIFDEATSALDNRTQAIVSQSLEQLRVTRIVIAHRLSTIRNADRIYVLEEGRVMQQGTFAQLAQQEGLFANLMARQMG